MKSKTFLILIILILALLIKCQAQTQVVLDPIRMTCKNCNQMDSQGNKNGLWVEKYTGGFFLIYYRNNKREGVFRQYSYGNGLSSLGEYSNGIPCGKWYYFGGNCELGFTEENIKLIDTTLITNENMKANFNMKSYFKSYYPNGIIKSEGQILYNDTPEIDFYKIGTWKYYDEKGNLIKTKEENRWG
jgi:antitoxin component YwqK of YwqJK toxin-antitoxin module